VAGFSVVAAGSKVVICRMKVVVKTETLNQVAHLMEKAKLRENVQRHC
jgi:hypothetical protein